MRTKREPSFPPLHFRHNFTALLVDYVSFSVAMAFVNPNVVLPAFASTLTDSEPLIGLVGTTLSAGWLLPQLGAAAVMAGKPRKKPYILAAIYAGRPLWFLLAAATWLLPLRYPAAALLSLYACIGLIFLLDAVGSVAWFDILAKAVPVTRRGRLIGGSQLVSGLLGIGIGILVGLILESPRLPYPSNYTLLFAITGVALVPSTVALTLLREPRGDDTQPRRSLPDFMKRLGKVWRGDPGFRRVMIFRWLVGMMNLALPFYILHAREVIGLPEAATGWFVSAQTAGGIVASISLGWLNDRKGPRPVIWVGAITALLTPLIALLIHVGRGSLLSQLYPLTYFLFGITNSSWLLGPLNYVLEIAPQGQRPLYVGLYNTLAGILVPASFVGGILLRVTSYPILFAVAAGGVAAALWVSLRLREPKQENAV